MLCITPPVALSLLGHSYTCKSYIIYHHLYNIVYQRRLSDILTCEVAPDEAWSHNLGTVSLRHLVIYAVQSNQ